MGASFVASLLHLLWIPFDLVFTVLAIVFPVFVRRSIARALGWTQDRHYVVRELPHTTIVGRAKQASLAEIPTLNAEMRACFASGLTLPIEARLRSLRALRALLAENEAEIMAALREDLGRPAFEALYYDVLLPLTEVDHMIAHIHEYAAPTKKGFNLLAFPGSAEIYKEPYGVVLVISTWNYPIMLSLVPVLGAIAAGNCVVLKPCNVSAASARLLARLVPAYLDPHVVTVVGQGADMPGDQAATSALLECQWDHIFFTGSPAVGRVVMQGAVKHLTPVTLELGGKNPVIVAADADIDLAAKRVVWGRNMNCGQQCISPDYVLVHEAVKDQFIARACHYVQQFYPTASDIGRIVGAKQFARIVNMVAESAGTTHIGGTGDASTLAFQPSVIEISLASKAMDDETFGPILWVASVASVDQAIDFVNRKPKPLSMYVFTASRETAERIVYNTAAGGVTVNATLFHVAHSELPFGGVGASGMGAYHGEATFRTFTHEKPVLHKAVWPDAGLLSDPFFLYGPFRPWQLTLVRFLVKLM
eukprot:a174666_32.p1 GENE.a174666_32~~a174666_32.p1  ORF type:complete len:544 (+),score=216.72 a174666_32:28-1632(+)